MLLIYNTEKSCKEEGFNPDKTMKLTKSKP